MKLMNMLGAAALAAATALPLSAQETPELRITLVPIFDTIPFHAAQDEGFFTDVGLTMDGTPSQGGARGIPAVMSGSAQIVFTNIVSILQAMSQGMPLKIIAPAQQTMGFAPDNAGIMTGADSGIETAADLSGKRVAVNTRNNIIWLYARHWIDQNGGDSSKVTFVEVPFPQMPDAVTGGQVDAAFVSQPFLGALMADERAKVLGWPYSFEDARTATSFYAVTAEFAEENPETIAAFTDALGEGIEWTNEHYGDAEAIDVAAGFTGMDPEVISKIMEVDWSYSPEINRDSIETTMNLLIEYGLIDGPVDLDAAIYSPAQ